MGTQIANRIVMLRLDEAGTVDNLVKPFAFKELLARVRALVRRRYTRPAHGDHLQQGLRRLGRRRHLHRQ